MNEHLKELLRALADGKTLVHDDGYAFSSCGYEHAESLHKNPHKWQIKPDTVIRFGRELPKPLQVLPVKIAPIFLVSPSGAAKVPRHAVQPAWINNGFCHLNKEDAQKWYEFTVACNKGEL